MEGYSLTIVGEEGLWLWFVDLNGHNAVEGATHNLHAAMAAAENAARRLADNGSSLPRA